MGKSSHTPKPPDYVGAARETGKQNIELLNQQTLANRSNQNSIAGNLTWQKDPVSGQWTQTATLSEPNQDIYNQQQSNQQGIADMAGGMLGNFDSNQVDLSKAPAMPKVGQYSQQATDLYNQLAKPQLQRQRASKEAQLAAMGMSLGTGKAYDTQQELLNDSENRSGMMGAHAGIEQGNKMFTQGMGLHTAGVDDIINQKKMNIGQLQGIMGLGQIMSANPTLAGTGTAAGKAEAADMMGALSKGYDAQLNATNAANADRSSMLGTLGTLGSAALTF